MRRLKRAKRIDYKIYNSTGINLPSIAEDTPINQSIIKPNNQSNISKASSITELSNLFNQALF